MATASNKIKEYASLISEKIGSVKHYIFVIVAIIAVITIGYYLSFNYRTNKKLSEIIDKHKSNIQFQTDYCHPDYKKYTLSDFHIKSSYNTALTGFKKYDYVSLDMIYEVLKLGTRYIEFEIFSKEQNLEAVPVVSIGSKTGDWKMTANVLDCQDVFNLISVHAFSQKLLLNYRDPLFIFLDIKTDNVKVLDKLAGIIEETLKIYLLNSTYNFQRRNIAEAKVCDLLEKVVIMTSKGYRDSELERLVNISTDNPYLERVNYSDLIIQKKFNVNQPDFSLSSNKISFHKGISNDYIEIHDYNINLQETNLLRDMKIKIGNSRFPQNRTKENLLTIDNITSKKISFKKHDTVSFRKEEQGNTILVQGFTMNEKAKDIEEVNKYRLTIVVPDFDLFSDNFNPKNIWYTGSQFVALNFQTIDENMKMNLKFFQKRALKLKQSSLLKNVKDLERDNTYPTNKVKKDLQRKFRSDCEEITERPQPTTTTTLSAEELEAKLKDYESDIQEDRVYPVNYDFLKKNLSLNVFFQPLFNSSLRLIKDNQNKLRMSIAYQGANFLFQIVNSYNKKINNSVRIVINDHFLGVNKDKSLRFYLSDGPESKETDFLDKTTFLLLEPVCGKSNYCSFGHVINEDIGNNQTTPVLNYLKIRNLFSTNNRIYTYQQNKYKKILTLKAGSFTRGNDEEAVETYTIWRPFKYRDFGPIGDVIFRGEQVPTLEDGGLLRSSIVAGGTKHPTGYEKVYSFEPKITSNDPMDKTDQFAIWKPIAPDGYISMGYVTVKNGGETPPPKNAVVCVKANFVKPAEIILDGGEASRYNKTYYNKKISFWKGKNLNYFIPTDTNIIDYNVSDQVFNLKPPSEFENPVYDFVDFSTFTDDIVYLDDNISNLSERESACFKYTVSYKSGEFSDYQLYNGLNEMPDQDGKIIAYLRSRNNGQLCVSLPNSYWSPQFKEISEPDTATEDAENIQGTYSYLTKYGKCPAENKLIGATVLATEENCFKIGGYMTNSQKFRASVSEDRTGQCYLDLCETRSDDTLYMNKKKACNEENKIADVKLKIPYKDCIDMGGEYIGPVLSPDSIVKCGIDICKRPTKYEYKLPRGVQSKGDMAEARFKMDVIQGERDLRNKCYRTHNDSIYDGSICDMPLHYNDVAQSTDLNVSFCRDKNFFGTSFKHHDDNTIRLRDNKDYCMSVELDNSGKAVTERKKNPKESGPDNKIKMENCRASRLGQQFKLDNTGNIRYLSNTEGLTDLCLTNEYDSSLRLNPCNPVLASQQWVFKNMPNDYCITVGSIVYYFKKETRLKKSYISENTFNLPVENLLQEEYDYDNIHMYIKGKVILIENNIIRIRNIKYPDIVITLNRESQLDEIALQYIPPKDKLELGAKIVGKNGGFSKIDGNTTITYTDEHVKWYGVITEKLKNGNFKVFFSINSIEPDQKNQRCGRPDYSMVKELTIDDFYLLKNPSVC